MKKIYDYVPPQIWKEKEQEKKNILLLNFITKKEYGVDLGYRKSMNDTFYLGDVLHTSAII